MNSIISKSITIPQSTDTRKSWLNAFELCARKTRVNIRRLADEPKAAPAAIDGNYFAHPEGFFEIGNWTSSFFTGMALLAWQQTEDESFLQQTLRLAPVYRQKVFDRFLDTHHDLGFLYSLYSVALYKLTADPAHRETGLRAAEVLAQRFNPHGNFIRAWGHMNNGEFDNMAIIDCLMNLPLLYWAAKESGISRYHEIAVKHADMALKYFIRPDDSVYHAYRFDTVTGKPLGGDTFGGWAVESHWARGTAWAIYGFALSYGFTGDSKYLEASRRVAKKFIANLDDEIIPMWDFKLPPSGQKFIRDSSAASVAVCGLQELEKHRAADAGMTSARNALLERMCREDYLNSDDDCCGVLKHGQIGVVTGGVESAYTSWGDYFLMEALARELFKAKTWW
ncbi:MAG TPA: glycoside hydrolase family 88 protein [Verrucomicrobiae bacterium]|nr:glycoside hydrolase family 88 protein [Verrucomicrobiae bacterium]